MLKLLVKDLEAWMKKERLLYASGCGKRFYVTIHAGPNAERYIVCNMVTGVERGFAKRGDAVRYFNNLNTAEK